MKMNKASEPNFTKQILAIDAYSIMTRNSFKTSEHDKIQPTLLFIKSRFINQFVSFVF